MIYAVVYLYVAGATYWFLRCAKRRWLLVEQGDRLATWIAWSAIVATSVLWPLSTVIGVVRAATGKAGRS